jgi:hypothetical protein
MSIKSLDSSTPDCFVLLSGVDTRQLRWRTTPAWRESGVDRDVSRGLDLHRYAPRVRMLYFSTDGEFGVW